MKYSGNMPIQVAYQWLVALAVIIILPLAWLTLYETFGTITAFFAQLFPNSFIDAKGTAANFQYVMWHFFLISTLIATFIWLINETMKQKRLEMP